MKERTLHAFYDLAVSPVSFTIFDFLYLAETERKFRRLEAIDLFIVADTGDGFRDDASPISLEAKRWRLRHILFQAGALLPSCRRTVFCPSREEADAIFDPTLPTFPASYSVADPVADCEDSRFLVARYEGKDFGTLRAPTNAVARVERWLKNRAAERKPVTITLRNSSVHPLRNSEFPQWLAFARWLDRDKYQPVFVRETGDYFGPPDERLEEFPVFDGAALDLELRLALYELGYLNLFVDSGPGALCMLDDATRCIRFKMIAANNPNAGPLYFYRRGYEPGMQWIHCTNYQKSVWEEDTREVIAREFEAMVDLIESGAPVERQPLPPVIATATRFVVGENAAGAISLCEPLVAREPDNMEAVFLLGRGYQLADRHDEAVQLFETVHLASGDVPLVLLSYAQSLIRIGRSNEAHAFLNRIVRNPPDDPELLCDVANSLIEAGNEDVGETILERVLEQKPDHYKACISLAQYYHIDNLTIPHAIEWYVRAAKLQPERAAIYFALADCYGRHAHYHEALALMNEGMVRSEHLTQEEILKLAMLQRNAGDERKARESFTDLLQGVDARIEDRMRYGRPVEDLCAAKAHLLVMLDRVDEARTTYGALARGMSPADCRFDAGPYLPGTPDRIARLREIVGGRDVFILAHGPSVANMDRMWPDFAAANACVFAVNRFRVFETGFMATTDSLVDVVMKTHYRGIRPHYDQLTGFLERDRENMFITSRWAMDRLGPDFPNRRDIEARFDRKLLYYGTIGGWLPATPGNPLRFAFSNTLTVLLVMAAIGGARRIFLFGADGGLSKVSGAVTHYGQGTPDFRLDVDDEKRRSMTSAFSADARAFDMMTLTALIAAERLFGFPEPEIYNVSPESAYSLFPRIDYDRALAILTAGNG